VTPIESCAVCHSDGSYVSAPAAHALPPIESVSNVAFAVNGLDLDVTFALAADGVPTAGYDTIERGYRTDGVTRTTIVDSLTLADNGGGNYTIKVLGGAAEAANDNRYLFRVAAGADSETSVYLYGDFPASPVEDLAISAEACNACHGKEGIDVHGGYFAAEDGGEPCLTCHGVGGVARLVDVAHGYHSGIRTWRDPITETGVTYPTYMPNCKVCHAEDAQLAAANQMTVGVDNCFSCHGSIEIASSTPPEDPTWDFSGNLDFHLTLDTETADCLACHTLAGARLVVTEFHNGLSTGNSNLIWNGADAAVEEGKRFTWQIDSIVDDETNLAISWTATYDDIPVDPCNATVSADNPVFHVPRGGSGGTFSMLRSYAQGDDFILGQSEGEDAAPGQPESINLDTVNTVCDGLVATTTIPVDEDVDATVGRVAIQGKPGVVSPASPTSLLRVRVPTPTFDWVLGTNNPAVARRNVVDTSKCLGCHVGSLYQHGGNRVDNVDVCMLCHNAASNEKNVRVGMGVDASEAYDGKVGETFELKTMLHRVHSSTYDWDPLPDDRNTPDVVENVKYNPPYLVYRNRGVYAFANDPSVLPNWTAGEDCVHSSGRVGRRVAGADPTIDDSCQPHNFEAPTYPRSLNECAACHTADFMVIPDQTKSMASTTDAGSTVWENKLDDTVWENKLDDTLQGAATTACVTCHADGASKGHAYQNGWTPQVFPDGRQTIIDAVN
jgi:OmcA/MtrC family decaheme c-type cytochrome